MGPADTRSSYSDLRAESNANYERFRPAQVLQNIGLTCSCLLMLSASGAVMWLLLCGLYLAARSWISGG